MIDLSDNNGAVDFHRAFETGQRRVYLKVTEGAHFVDLTYRTRLREARNAGFKVGGYHFARPSQSSPREEADLFLKTVAGLEKNHSLRHVLDLEDPNITPSHAVSGWATEWMDIVFHHTGWRVLLYSFESYVDECRFSTCPNSCKGLWIAAFGPNDGREHPFVVPEVWKPHVLAHQYTSVGRVAGVPGDVDISRPLRPALIDVT